MNTKRLLERVTKNWPVKAICFVLAILIYFFHQMDMLKTNVYTIPLEIRANGSVIPVSGNENLRYVRVFVRANKDSISSISENTFKAFVDVSSEKEGIVQCPVYIDVSEKGLLIDPLELSARPEKVEFKLEKKLSKAVPVRPSIAGKPAYGYKSSSVVVEPAHVTVVGPESMISEMQSLSTQAISLEGVRNSFEKDVSILNTNYFVSILEGQKVNVNVSIVPEGMVKEMEKIPVSMENLPLGFRLASDTPVISLTLEGRVLDIEKVTAKQIRAFCDCSNVEESGEYEFPLQLDVPSSLKITSQSTDKIMVRFEFSGEDNTRR